MMEREQKEQYGKQDRISSDKTIRNVHEVTSYTRLHIRYD